MLCYNHAHKNKSFFEIVNDIFKVESHIYIYWESNYQNHIMRKTQHVNHLVIYFNIPLD